MSQRSHLVFHVESGPRRCVLLTVQWPRSVPMAGERLGCVRLWSGRGARKGREREEMGGNGGMLTCGHLVPKPASAERCRRLHSWVQCSSPGSRSAMLSYGPWPCMSSCRLPTSHRVSTVLSHPACTKPGSISPHPVLPPSPLVDSICQHWAGMWDKVGLDSGRSLSLRWVSLG